MDLKNLLGKLDVIEGTMASAEKNPTGPKFTGQWKGTDAGTPGKKLVGDSILRDLGKGKSPKSKEQELSEEFQAFLEAEFQDTADKRPRRTSDRHPRGHEPKSGYKTIKTEDSLSDKDIELQDYRSMSHKEFQTAYGMTKTEWINKNKALVIQNPSIKKALGLDEAVGQEYTVVIDRKGREKPVSGTMEELLDYFGYTLETGKSYEHEKGRYKINMNPKNAEQLVNALNKAATNAAANSSPSTYYSLGEGQVDEGVAYKGANPHPASKDPIVAKVLKQMRPGLTGLDMNNEAFLYFAYEIGKMRAREMWEDYGPAIKYFYQSGIGVNEGWESGPEEYEEPYDDADDAYDRQRQEKIDTEAEKEWAKLPKVSTYKLTGRGPNMEPNYEFGDEFDTLEQALKYREEIMKDPNTPHPEHIGIRTITRVVNKEQTDEAVIGGGGVKDLNDYVEKRDYIYQQLADIKQKDNYPYFKQALFDLMRTAREKGIEIEESRAHKQLATWFKNRELAQKFASGEVKIPTPQERKAELEKPKKKVDEYGADNVTPYGQPTAPKVDPKQAAQIAQGAQAFKAATGITAPATNIAKALDDASQGKPADRSSMKVLEPAMQDLVTIMSDPKLGNEYKTLAQKVNKKQQTTN
jgi:hypothetical protein